MVDKLLGFMSTHQKTTQQSLSPGIIELLPVEAYWPLQETC